MPKISDEQLSELRTKNPRGVKLFTVVPDDAGANVDGDDFVFRKVDRAAYTKHRALQKRALVSQGGGDEATLLARELLVHPTVEEFDALRERAPALPEDMGNMLLEDASAGLMVREGKR